MACQQAEHSQCHADTHRALSRSVKRQGTYLKSLSQLHGSYTLIKVGGHICAEGDGDAVQQVLHRARTWHRSEWHHMRYQHLRMHERTRVGLIRRHC